MRNRILLMLIALIIPAEMALAQTGKISGQVTDASTGEPLPGVNVVIAGTTTGATTDPDGYYTILNVPPGTYSLRASFIGYTPETVEEVRVNIDLTSEVNFSLQEETVGLDEVVVTAQEPVVRPDISANVANLSSAEIENLPVASVEEVIGLQAGIEPGMSIRGSGLNQVAFMVDGNSMRDGRNNTPFTGISYTSVDAVQVQTGGFSAEYGNVRSGLINVVTKEGPRDRYTLDLMVRYAPPQKRYFGPGPNDPNSYFMRPYLDPEVALTGTRNGGWDQYTQRQYPEFKGWNAVINEWHSDDDPTNDLTLEQFYELFDYYHRKDIEIDRPDYEIDATVGGPVPLVGRALGDLRFLASYRQTQTPLFIPQLREAYTDNTANLKLSSDVSRSMKLTLQGMYAQQHSMLNNENGFPNMFTGEMPRYPWSDPGSSLVGAIADGSNTTARIWANHVYNPTDVTRALVSADFTHTLSANTFYKVRLQRMASDYHTWLPEEDRRDPSRIVHTIGSYQLDDAPLSYWPANIFAPDGQYLSGHWAKARDSSRISIYSGRFDITHQATRFAQLKGGLEYIYSNYDINHRQVNEYFKANLSPVFIWERQPVQGAAYLQTKLEFQSLVANIGLRADYWHAGGEWYAYDRYSPAFSALYGKDQLDEVLEQVPTRRMVELSPRLGISFPITTQSKLFFNYGHFRQMNNPHDLFIIREVVTGAVDQVGNPDHPMPTTVAYELGYEHSLFNRFLIRATGYYKALGNQTRAVRYVNLDETVDYTRSEPLNYADIRGVELTLYKNVGKYVRGFVNVTYMAAKRGNFGFGTQFENQVQQREYERDSRAHYQSRPVPEPYARFNLEFLGPRGFGPQVLGLRPLGDWRLNLLGEWRAGQVFTWSGDQTIRGLQNNVRWKDYYNLDLRFSKAFEASGRSAQFFIDVTNVLNLRHLRRHGNFFSDGGRDWQEYMMSLHLPEGTFNPGGIYGDREPPYPYIVGKDRPGDYRKPGVEFVPIEIVEQVANVQNPLERPLYYEQETRQYMKWNGTAWQQADSDLVDQVLDDKAYIDMPNVSFLNFLNPRMVRFGIRVSF